MADHATARIGAASAYAQNIFAMQAAVEAAGARFVHVLQPTALGKKKMYPCEEYSFRWNGAAYKDFEREMSRQYEMLGESVAAISKMRSGGIYLDLSRATDDIDEPLYDDWHHASTNGRLPEMVGKIIGTEILRNVQQSVITGTKGNSP
jgi:hypothetical protein